MRKSIEVWHGKQRKAVVTVRDQSGEFASGNASDEWTLEVWDTRKGALVKPVLRRSDGTFLAATNLRVK